MSEIQKSSPVITETGTGAALSEPTSSKDFLGSLSDGNSSKVDVNESDQSVCSSKKRRKRNDKSSKCNCFNSSLASIDLSSSFSIPSYYRPSQCAIRFLVSPSIGYVSIDIPPWWLLPMSNVVDILSKNEAEIVSLPLKHSGFTILKVERIQSLYLWRRYLREVKYLDESRGDTFTMNEQILYHTSKADKAAICSEGLFLDNGKFGRGIYFSDRPVKCDNECDGNKVMYACKVLLGNVRENEITKCSCDEGLKPITSEPCYDSVKGYMKHGEEYVVFHSFRCLPLYIITYQVD